MRYSKGGIQFESGAKHSWLEATPIVFTHPAVLYVLLAKNMWERHLAAKLEHFELDPNAVIGQKMKIPKPVWKEEQNGT